MGTVLSRPRRITASLRSPVAQTFLTTLLMIGFGLGSGIELARGLGPHGRGQVAAALLWPGLLVSLGALGLSQAVVVFTVTESRDRASIIFSTAVGLGLGLSIVAIGLGELIIPWLLRSQTVDVIRASRIILPMVPAGMLSGFIVAALQGRSTFLALNFVRAITPAGYLAGITALTLLHRLTVMNAALLQLLFNYCTLGIGYALLLRQEIRFSPREFEKELARSLLGFGSRAYVGGLTGTLNQRLDQTLLAALFPPTQLGLYSVAVSASSAVDTIGFAFRTVASARIARHVDVKSKLAELRHILTRFWPVLLSATAALTLLLPALIPFFYGKAFRGSIVPAEILLLAQMFYTAKSLLTSSAEAFGDSWLGSKAELIGFAPTALLLIVLMPKFGISGAAFAGLIACAIQLGVMMLGFARKGLIQKTSATASQQLSR